MQPLVIIGAPRSGTNMLRDCLTSMPLVASWPCDEINYIWRYRNARHPDDELPVELADEKVKQYIRRAFSSVASRSSANTIVEKTCANSLRVNFVDAILPNAKYIYIRRSGQDVVASAMKRWSAPLDLPYLWKKVRYVPVSDIPYYGFNYAAAHAYRFFSGTKRLSVWGPKIADMDTVCRRLSLPEICAVQWRRCVDRSEADLAALEPSRVHSLTYEDFVDDPYTELQKCLDFSLIPYSNTGVREAVAGVSRRSVGKWESEIPAQAQALVNKLVNGIVEQDQRD